MMDDSFPRRSPSPPPSPVDHAVLRSQAVPNDFASFTIFMSSMFAGSTYAVHYHSPSTVLLSPPIASGLSFSVSRYRIPHDRFAITIDQDTKLQKGADIIYKSPLLSVDRTTGRIREEARLKAIILEVRIPSHEPIRKHPNIVRLLGMAWDRDLHSSLMMPTLIVEYGDKGTLTEYVTNAGPLSLPCKLRLSLDIVEGLLALHRAGVVHADIKASNIVIFTSKGGVTAKILDFGSAVLLDEVPDEGTAELSVYSPLWNAPEYRERIPKIAIPAVDAYSFGLVFWQLMMESEDPFSHDVFRPPASSPHHSQAPNMQYIQELKLLEDDHFLEKAWEMLLSQSDWAASDQTSLRFVMENSVRRDWHKRDLHRIRKHLAVRVHGETSQSQADHKTEIASTTDRSIGDEQYRHISINYEELRLLDHPTKSRIFHALEHTAAADADTVRRAEACLQLAICSVIAFGTSRNPTQSLRWLVESAQLGHAPAQAIVKRMHDAFGVMVPDGLRPALLEWLTAAVETGSFIAAEDLRQACEVGDYPIEEYRNAMARFHTAHFSGDAVEKYVLNDPSRLVEQLKLETSCSPNEKGEACLSSLDDRGDNLLHWAASTGNILAIEAILLVDVGLINVANKFQETPLLSACRSGQFQSASCLLDHCADASISTTCGETPLHWLISFTDPGECKEIARRLEQAGASVSAIAQPDRHSVPHIVNGLISGTPLHRATARNHLAAVDALLALDKPADPFVEGGPSAVALGLERPTPIVWASAAHQTAILRLFLQRTGRRQLVCGGLLAMMWRRNVDCTLLFYAVYADDTFQRMLVHGRHYEQAMKETVDLLIERGADPNRVISTGSTALYSAAERGDCATVQHLLGHRAARAGLNKTAKGQNRMTPIHVAILWGWRDVFNCLLDANADLSAKWGNGSSCLHMCACAKVPDLQIAEAIVKRDAAQVHVMDNETPFSTAVRHSNFDIADLLLNCGADKDALNGDNRTTTLLGMLAARGTVDGVLAGVRYLLQPRPDSLIRSADLFVPPNFIVVPAGKISALHIPLIFRLQAKATAGFEYLTQFGTVGPLMSELLKAFSEPEQLNAQDYQGMTALHYAVLVQDVEAVAEILKYSNSGLNVNAFTPTQATALGIAEYAALRDEILGIVPRMKEQARRRAAVIQGMLREAGSLCGSDPSL